MAMPFLKIKATLVSVVEYILFCVYWCSTSELVTTDTLAFGFNPCHVPCVQSQQKPQLCPDGLACHHAFLGF